MNKINGFTLIEMIVVVAILGIILVTLSSTLFSILSGSSKSEVANIVKQNGEYVISVIDQTVRGGRDIVVSPDGSSITVVNPDGNGTTTQIACVADRFELTKTSSPTISDQRITSDKVAVSDCNVFTSIDTIDNNPPGVSVNFELSQSAVAGKASEQSRQRFQTTVFLRVYK